MVIYIFLLAWKIRAFFIYSFDNGFSREVIFDLFWPMSFLAIKQKRKDWIVLADQKTNTQKSTQSPHLIASHSCQDLHYPRVLLV